MTTQALRKIITGLVVIAAVIAYIALSTGTMCRVVSCTPPVDVKSLQNAADSAASQIARNYAQSTSRAQSSDQQTAW